MNYANLAFRLRPRSAYEAADLGMQMARRWWWPLASLWLLAALPFFVVCLLLFDTASIALVVFWWGKPLYERPLLYYLSRAVFSENPSRRETLKMTPRLMARQLIQTLTIRRFSPSRSFDTPVAMLEGLKGAERSRRLAVLHRDKAGSVAFWLTVIGAHVELCIALSIVTLGIAILPESYQWEWETLFAANYLQAVCSFIAMAMMAPFFVAGGFGLYLNRRVILEGWDLELVFRDMQAKAANAGQVLVVALLAPLILCGIGYSPDLSAQETLNSELVTPAVTKEQIQEILNSEDFRRIETHRIPKFWDDLTKSEEDSDVPDIDPWGFSLGENLALIFQWLAWIAVTLMVLYLVYRYRDRLLALSIGPRKPKVSPPAPSHVLNLDIREISLPDDIGLAAQQLWQQGKQREALALLYRASLSRLVHRHKLLVNKGSTEGDCLRRVKKLRVENVYDYFKRLTSAWQAMAYAHLPPAETEFGKLSQTWPVVFDTEDQAQETGGE